MKQVDAKPFDAYHKWLAIPPHEQPPNHYRLLGVELFEEDSDVIAAAADRQMAHIKSFAAGKYASHSQRLLNELAAARICLLNAEQKARYDMQLKRQSPVSQLSEQLPPPPVLEIDVVDRGPYRSKRRKRQNAPTVIAVVVVGGAMGLLAGYGALTLIKPNRVNIQTVPTPKQVSKAEPRSNPPAGLREQSQRPRTIGRQPLDAPVNSAPIPPGAMVRQQRPQPPIPNLEDRVRRRAQEVDDPESVEPVDVEDEKLPLPSIVVPLTLDDPTIVVLATPAGGEVKDLQCDIGLSQNLLRRSGGGDHTVHEIVVEGLGNRGKHTAEFAAGVEGCQVGLEISVIHRSSAAVCNIRPRFSLPSGDVQPLTIRDFANYRKRLATMLSKVEGAKSSVSRLRATRDRQSQRASNARSGMSPSGGNPAADSIARSAARSQVLMAEAAVERAEKRIADAQDWISNESAIQREASALKSISEYANSVAANGSIYIRFHVGEMTVPATVK
jgi:hypothetical protein